MLNRSRRMHQFPSRIRIFNTIYTNLSLSLSFVRKKQLFHECD